ncbi:NADPH-dependent F420 reductase [Denitrobaculum tricleocarpae]|nr:NAD(P)-binding domain-containing protein [Denitrobaculum tricleocarpae]
MKRIAVIGSGNMGRALGVRLAQLGHSVMFGARRSQQAEAAATRAGANARAGTNDEASAHGDILIWTIREEDPSKVLENPDLLKGKIVIDLNNRDYSQEVRNGAWFDHAIAEGLQVNAPNALVVKAWNTIAMESFDTDPASLEASNAQTFIAGDSASAKSQVAELSKDLGFKAVDLGSGPAAFRAAEALGDVIRLLMIDGGMGGRAHLTLSQLPEAKLGTIGRRAGSEYK